MMKRLNVSESKWYRKMPHTTAAEKKIEVSRSTENACSQVSRETLFRVRNINEREFAKKQQIHNHIPTTSLLLPHADMLIRNYSLRQHTRRHRL